LKKGTKGKGRLKKGYKYLKGGRAVLWHNYNKSLFF